VVRFIASRYALQLGQKATPLLTAHPSTLCSTLIPYAEEKLLNLTSREPGAF